MRFGHGHFSLGVLLEPFMRTIFSIAIVLCCSATAAAQNVPEACADGKCIQVGSYNIEFLGRERAPFEGVERGIRTDEQIDRIVNRLTTELDLEIIAFQEIDKDSEQWKKIRDQLATEGYRFFDGLSSDSHQFVILAWDADEVTLQPDSAQELHTRNKFDFGNGCTDEGLRRPVAARFKAGEFDFWAIGVHLKSRRGEAPCTTQIRTEQCKDLKAEIDKLVAASGEGDVLIVGDLNERPGHDSFKPLTDAGFVSQMLVLMPQSAKGSYVKNFELDKSVDLIDQVMIRPDDTKEVVPVSGYIMPLASSEEAKRYIIEQSDHVPVCVSFSTAVDLD
jgi:hypothetical protein